jgi:hypothetical protein
MSPRTLLPALALVALLVVPAAPAVADQAIAELGRESPVAASGGWEAWSRYDEASGRYALMLRAPTGAVNAAALPTSDRPWDVALGPDRDHNIVAVYRSCGAGGCDLRRYNTASGHDMKLSAVSSPTYDEATPAIWGSTVVFTRRVRGCDVPYVKDLRSSAPSRRLLGRKCLQTDPGQASIRGSRIVISSVDFSRADRNGAGIKVAEVRAYSSRARGSDVLLRQTFGEESNLFGQVAQDARFAYTVRYGLHSTNPFVRVPLAGGAPEEVNAFRTLTGAFAKPAANAWLYVEVQGGEEAGCDGFTAVPCRVVYAPDNPWLQPRTLTPELSVAYTGQPRSGQPLTFSGALTQRVVSRDTVTATNPLPGVTVELYHRTGSSPERFVPTGLRAVTDAAGHYDIVLPAAGADPFYTAVASTPGVATWAGRGTVGSVAP